MQTQRARWWIVGLSVVALAACAGQQDQPSPKEAVASAMGLDGEGCQEAQIVKFTAAAGGKVSLGSVTVEAKAGDLKSDVALEVAACPGATPHKLKAVESSAVVSLPSTRIRFADKKAHGPLPVAAHRQLRYCVDTAGLAPDAVEGLLVVHDKKVAPPHPDTMVSEAAFTAQSGKLCVGFAHLSWWHHLKHKIHHLKHKVHHAVHKAEHAVKKEAKKGVKAVKKQVKKLLNICYDCKKAVGLAANAVTCGNTWAKTKMTAECLVRLDAEFPGLLEFTPAICGAVTAGVSALCKKLVKGSKLGSLEDKLKELVCTKVKACKK